MQVLGSGGPFVGSERASTGYLVWREGRAVVMVDVGGGTFARFGEAGAILNDLSVLAVSHLHPDHVTDLPGLLWLSDAARDRPLPLVGPPAGGVFPDIATFVSRLFDSNIGAYPALAGTLRQTGRGIPLVVHVVDATTPSVVHRDGDLVVRALPVPHGAATNPTPSIAYRVELDGRSIVFGSDQNGSDPRFEEYAREADVLVLHFAVSEQAPAATRAIHAPPHVEARIARDAGARSLVLCHVMIGPAESPDLANYSGTRLDDNLAVVRGYYAGSVEVARDLQCFPLP
jgi:ribonuclease BN (tRNA processing enzyme)